MVRFLFERLPTVTAAAEHHVRRLIPHHVSDVLPSEPLLGLDYGLLLAEPLDGREYRRCEK